MQLFNSVSVGAIIAFLVLIASWMLNVNEDDEKSASSRSDDWILAILFGALAGAINYFVPSFYGETAFLAPVSLIICLGITGFTVYWWDSKGSSFKEMLPFIGIVVVVYFVTKAAALMTASLISSSTGMTLLMVLPEIALVLALGFFVANMFYYRYRESAKKDSRNANFNKAMAVIAAIIAALIVFILLFTRVYWGDLDLGAIGNTGGTVNATGTTGSTGQQSQTTVTGSYAGSVIPTKVGNVQFPGTVGFYNLSIQDDGLANDFNFGPSPMKSGATAADYDLDLRQRMAYDPALTAAVLAWFDANTGTRFLGTFYESCKEDWAETINYTRDNFIADTDLWYLTLVKFYALLDDQTTALLKEGSGLKDQMYMNPYTLDGVPDVIVMVTDQETGCFLVYAVTIKGNVVEVPYRLECGYQPTNVQEVMGIAPQPTPEPQPNPTPGPNPTPDPQPTPDPTPSPDPTPTPTPTPKPQKDPSKSPSVNTEPNDDPGPGPSTNNGAGATTSTADQPTNSNHGSLSDYNQAISDLANTNASQKTGSDSSTPSTPAPTPSTHVDNNGDKGNGGASINTPTPVSAPATVADTGQAISDSPGEAWGGPAD